MSKKKEPLMQVAVFKDGKLLITSFGDLRPDQVERLGQNVRKWYENPVPAALCIPNAEMFIVDDEPGGENQVLGIAYPKKMEDDPPARMN